MAWLPIFLVVFLAIFTQSLTGFGLALISMPLLTAALGLQTAAPLVALVGMLAELALLVYYRQALSLTVVWRLALASLVGVPIGLLALRHLEERAALTILGLVVAGYALYALLNLRLPALQRTVWAYIAGFLAGVLGGAYNTSGPPVIIFGHSQGWPPAGFKANLQGFFLFNGVIILAAHFLAGNVTETVWSHLLVSLPAVGLGLWAGLKLDRRLKPEAFRRLVLVALLALGIRLLLA
jgi:uncharacterized protein